MGLEATADWPAHEPRTRSHPNVPWTSERIVAALRAWAQETGRPPTTLDWDPGTARSMGRPDGEGTQKFERERDRWPGSTTVYRLFPSWGAALRAAGLPVHYEHPELTVAERVEIARRLAGDGLTTRAIAESLGVNVETAARYLRAHPCTDCGGPVIGSGPRCRGCAARAANPRRYSRQHILAAARAWEIETGAMPTKQAWSSTGAKWSEEAPRWPPSVAVDQVFGSWSEFRRELTGVIYNAPWSRDQVLDAIRRYHRLHGRAPAKNAWEVGAPPDYPSSATVQRLFGTFTAAIREAGFTPAGEAARRAAPRT